MLNDKLQTIEKNLDVVEDPLCPICRRFEHITFSSSGQSQSIKKVPFNFKSSFFLQKLCEKVMLNSLSESHFIIMQIIQISSVEIINK